MGDDGKVADASVTHRRTEAAVAGHESDERAARPLLSDAAATVRSTALAALARMGAATDADVAVALADPDPGVRRRAIEAAIGRHDLPLVAHLGDPDATVVEQAAWACGERQPPEVGAVAVLSTIATDHDDALCREAAVAALGAIGDPEGLAAILAATGDKATVRRRAIIALAPFEGPAVDAALRLALEDRDWQVRQAAEDLLA